MPRMTVVLVVTMRRKTRFPTGVATSSTKAKPPAVAAAFCVLSLPYLILGVVAFAIGLLIFLLRQRLRLIATPLPFRDALRRAGDLRLRVARGAYRLRRILLSPFPAGVTMPAVVIFNREKIVVIGGCGITIYRDFYAFAATFWAKKVALFVIFKEVVRFIIKAIKYITNEKKTICNHVAFYLHLVFSFMQQRRW